MELDQPTKELLMYGVPGGLGIVLGIALPEKYRNERIISLVAGLGLSGYGIYRYYKETQAPAKKFPIQVTDPEVAERWSCLIPHTVEVSVGNPYENPEHLWVGCSAISGVGKLYDFPAREVDIQPGITLGVSWWFKPSCLEGEDWRLRSSVWDVKPGPGVTGKHRVGDSGWIPFKVVWLLSGEVSDQIF